MKNLIYQCWYGRMRPGVLASKKNMEAYAKSIGAEYRFDHDIVQAGKICDCPIYYEWLNPLLDKTFWDYDNVAIVDVDIFAVEDLRENLFDDMEDYEVGICEEPLQPKLRTEQVIGGCICNANDKLWLKYVKQKWNVDLPLDDKGRPKVYNAGMVVFSKAGLEKARKTWVPFQEYMDYIRSKGMKRFYWLDQNYAHAMLEVANMKWKELDTGWNSQIHYWGKGNPRPIIDLRNDATKFVHVQLRGADDWSEDELHRVTNQPINEWNVNR
jgi:hypothetical protein